MAQSRSQPSKGSRIERPLIIGALSVALTALLVELSRTGVDIFLLVVVGFAVIIIERTIGDWLGELLGSGRAAVVLTVCLGAVVWSLFDQGGVVDKFLVVASKAGYTAAYFGPEVARRTQGSSGPSVTSAAVVGSSGVSTAQSPPIPASSPVATTAPTSEIANAPPKASDRTDRADNRVQSFKQLTVRFVDVSTVAIINEGLQVRARFLADGHPLPRQPVDFLVNERAFRRVLTAEDGTATTQFSTRVPGTYKIRARLAEASLRGTSAAMTVTILPGRR